MADQLSKMEATIIGSTPNYDQICTICNSLMTVLIIFNRLVFRTIILVFRESPYKAILKPHLYINNNRFQASFLAHLSRRLKGELIVYRSIRRPCVR